MGRIDRLRSKMLCANGGPKRCRRTCADCREIEAERERQKSLKMKDFPGRQFYFDRKTVTSMAKTTEPKPTDVCKKCKRSADKHLNYEIGGRLWCNNHGPNIHDFMDTFTPVQEPDTELQNTMAEVRDMTLPELTDLISRLREELEGKERLRKLLIETVMRANLALPTTEEEMKWFDDKADVKKSDFFERLMAALPELHKTTEP